MKRLMVALLLVVGVSGWVLPESVGSQAQKMPAAVTVLATDDHTQADGERCSIINQRTGFAAMLSISAESGKPTYFSRALSGGTLVEQDGVTYCEVKYSFELPYDGVFLITIGQDFEELVGQAEINQYGEYTVLYEPEEFSVPTPTPTAEPTPDVTNDVPALPTATAAWRAGAVPASSENYLDEPLLMVFDVYGFASPDEAKAQLEPLSDWYVEHQSILLETPISEFTEVSLGPLGDDRRAFLREAYGEDPPYLLAVIQVGPNILVVDALSYGGDITAFVGDYLDAFLAGATDDPLSLVPDVSDLPRGWALVRGSPMDRLAEVKGTAATPAS